MTHVPSFDAKVRRNETSTQVVMENLYKSIICSDQLWLQKFTLNPNLRNKITKKNLQPSWFLSSYTRNFFAPPYTSPNVASNLFKWSVMDTSTLIISPLNCRLLDWKHGKRCPKVCLGHGFRYYETQRGHRTTVGCSPRVQWPWFQGAS